MMADELYPNYKDIDEFVTSMFDYAKVTDPFDCDMPQHECAVQSILQASSQDEEIERLTVEVTGLRGLVRAVASETSIPMEEIEQSIAAVQTTEGVRPGDLLT